MPIIMLLGSLLYVTIRLLVEEHSAGGKRQNAFTYEQIDELSRRMIGKSQEECKRILQSYNQK